MGVGWGEGLSKTERRGVGGGKAGGRHASGCAFYYQNITDKQHNAQSPHL